MTWPAPANFTVDPDTGEVRLGPVEPGVNDDLGYWEGQLLLARAAGGRSLDARERAEGTFWERLLEISRHLGLKPKT